jgi:SAM-dependent methyltransferase
MYTIGEVSLADNRRLIQFNVDQIFGAKFFLKGFEYPWVLSSREWKSGEKVLDVGAAYSPLPAYIAKARQCEVWAVDDFGTASDEDFWTRNQDPQEHIRANPQVKFVLERLGDPANSSLPEGYFDCIYSASTLEHVPAEFTPAVWRHMDRLLKPGGTMLHAIDISLKTKRGWLSLAKALLLEYFIPLMPSVVRTRYTFYTPRIYARTALSALGQSHQAIRRLPNAFATAIDPEVMLESPKALYHRVVKDNIHLKQIGRTTALLLSLEKSTTK